MNVYVREMSRQLGRMGLHVDVFTRSQNSEIARVVEMGPNVRVVHLAAGPEAPLPRVRVHRHLGEFVERLETFRERERVTYDLIHGHYWLSGVVGLTLKARWGAPLVQMFHTLGRLKNRVARAPAEIEPDIRIEEERRIVREADRIVAANAVERAHLVWHYGATPARIAVIPCGVDTDLFRPMPSVAAKAALGLAPEPLLLYVGRLTPIKGVETLLEAVALLTGDGASRDPGLKLLAVGGDTDEPQNGHLVRLRQRAAGLGLRDAVRFLGAQPQERLRLYYAAAQMTVIPSYYESFGMVALEAMACGKPVIASRVGGLTTTVQDGATGYLVPEGNPRALAERIAALLADPALQARLGREAVRRALQYRWSYVAESVLRLFCEVAAKDEQGRVGCRGLPGGPWFF